MPVKVSEERREDSPLLRPMAARPKAEAPVKSVPA